MSASLVGSEMCIRDRFSRCAGAALGPSGRRSAYVLRRSAYVLRAAKLPGEVGAVSGFVSLSAEGALGDSEVPR
eukprot:598133-Alexandrium_andersonii.AAC.1